jgi:ribosomal protein L11 methyltransferase
LAGEVFVEIRGRIPEASEDELAQSLSNRPVLGVQIESEASGMIEVRVWTRQGDDNLVAEVRRLLTSLGSDEVKRSSQPAEDWSARWREGLTAFEVGRRWWIDPDPDRTAGAPDDRLRIVLVPRSAFGSGTHESTQLVLLQLEDLECRGKAVLDVGTGSGVLAVAADCLGAKEVVALDIDLIAAWEAARTAECQSWPCAPRVLAGPIECLGDAVFDVVLCNMIVSEFGPMLDEMRRLLAPRGKLILSGILACERQAVETMLVDRGLPVVGVRSIGEWISVCAMPGGEA